MDKTLYDIPGFGGFYKITRTGEVWSVVKNRFRKFCEGIRGDQHLMLYKDKVGRRYLKHRLMAITFIPNPEGKPEVNHIDGNPRNNELSNLEWVTPKENIAHAHNTGLFAEAHIYQSKIMRGEGNPRKKLTEEQVRQIRELIASGAKRVDLANRYNVTQANIRAIVNRRTWRHI